MKVEIKPGQSIEDALKKFNYQVRNSGTHQAIRNRETYVKRGSKRRAKRKKNTMKKNNY